LLEIVGASKDYLSISDQEYLAESEEGTGNFLKVEATVV
jgi:hypothetical protein